MEALMRRDEAARLLDIAWNTALPGIRRTLYSVDRWRGMTFRPVTCTLIDRTAITAWYDGWAHGGRFSWPSVQIYTEEQNPWFHMALWCDGQLCCLAAGRPAREVEAARYGFNSLFDLTDLEGAPFGHPLKGMVATYALQVLWTYAGLLGFGAVRAKSPTHDRVRELYSFHGLAILDGDPDRHCFRSLR